jgi:hypothetical protein
MSQLVLDDQLDVQEILPALKRWITAIRLQELRPGEHILDDRVPEILQSLNKATFLTIDHGFWDRRLCHPDYCILYFALRKDEQHQLPRQLRRLFRLPQFRTRSAQMGVVARIQRETVVYWKEDKKLVLDLPKKKKT